MINYSEWKSCVSQDDAPTYVKQASFGEAEPSMSRGSYLADQVHMDLPCNNPAEIWASASYFAKHAESYDSYLRDDIDRNIRKAAEIFGITADVEKALSPAVEVKQASDDDYGWSKDGDRKYPMFDGYGVKKAADYFEENKYKYPFAMRSSIARNILKKAGQFGVDVPDSIRKTAGYGIGRPDNVINELVLRAELSRDPDTALALAKMAEHVAEHGVEAITASAMKIAELIEDTDVIEHRHDKYGRTFSAPEDFLFDMDVKEAEALVNDVIELGGAAISLRKLAELPDSLFDGVLGDGFADSVKEAGAIDPRRLGEALASRPVEDRNELHHAIRGL